VSQQWMQHLQFELLSPPSRLRSYVHWHLSSDTLGRNLYRPAPHLTHQNAKYQLEMLRIRTQSWIDYTPSHLHYQRGPADQAPYQDRLCPLCLPAAPPVLVDEKHMISQCPASRAVLHDPKFFNRFQGLMRLIDTQPFQLLDSEEQIRAEPPPLPNAQRFPHLETGSQGYVRRVCPRLLVCAEVISKFGELQVLCDV